VPNVYGDYSKCSPNSKKKTTAVTMTMAILHHPTTAKTSNRPFFLAAS
jgi:hypothetical protein